MPYRDKEDRAEYARLYRERNKDKINENARKSHRVKKRKEYLAGYSVEKKKQIADAKAKYYKSNKQFVAEKVKARSQEHIALVLEIKKHYGCMNRGCKWIEKPDPTILDFHHVDPRLKKRSVLALASSSLAAIAKEINKCVLVCANCHRLAHAGLADIPNLCYVNPDLSIGVNHGNDMESTNEVVAILSDVIQLHHQPRLADARIAICFDDSKPFLRNKLNLGKVTKFSPLARLWQGSQYDFCLSIPMDLWHSVLKGSQRAAYLDLQLTRCTVEYKPEEIEENGKKKKVKDEWGRVQYTQEVKTDDEGNPKWKVVPLDLEVFADNVRRYGLWMDSLEELASVCLDKHYEAKQKTNKGEPSDSQSI